MSLKDVMMQDISVFINSDEFATTVTLGANEINAIETTYIDQDVEHDALIISSSDAIDSNTVTIGLKTYYVTAMREDPEDKLLTYIILGAEQ